MSMYRCDCCDDYNDSKAACAKSDAINANYSRVRGGILKGTAKLNNAFKKRISYLKYNAVSSLKDIFDHALEKSRRDICEYLIMIQGFNDDFFFEHLVDSVKNSREAEFHWLCGFVDTKTFFGGRAFRILLCCYAARAGNLEFFATLAKGLSPYNLKLCGHSLKTMLRDELRVYSRYLDDLTPNMCVKTIAETRKDEALLKWLADFEASW